MLGDAVAFLRCPVCSAALRLDGRVVRCASGHGFDVARQGYVNLAPPAGAAAGDTAAMVAARAAFLAGGHYEPIARAVADAAASGGPEGCVVDVGAGTGWYLARVLERRPGVGIALDASRYAARRAARAHPRIASVVCDAWRALPVADEVAAAVLSVFAPRNGAEIARVLRPGGILVLVTPTPRHLAELVEPLGLLSVDARKDERLERTLAAAELEPVGETVCEFGLELSGDEVTQLVAMGPSAHHVDPGELRERVAALGEPVAVTASVTLAVRRRSSG